MQKKLMFADVLIIGSGPVGSTFARTLADSLPGIKIIMLDLGPKISSKVGIHIKNILDPKERTAAQILSQGPNKYVYAIPTTQERAAAAKSEHFESAFLARPGTHLVAEDDFQLNNSGMPAASYSSNIGGMGVHWTCACPRPGNTERVPFIDERDWDKLLTKAEKLLFVSQTTFKEFPESNIIQKKLEELFNNDLPEGRKVQRMPLACKSERKNKRYWVGTDVILGHLLKSDANGDTGFEVRSDTVCRQIISSGSKVTGAWIEHLPSGLMEKLNAGIVVVAADAIRTPQLLWASGIRPLALGHYLNDQPQIMCMVHLRPHLPSVEEKNPRMGNMKNSKTLGDRTLGIFWVPFHDAEHPFHGQVMHMDLSPIQIDIKNNNKGANHVIGLGWFCRKELRFEDYLEFDETKSDYFGLPKITIHYQLTDRDREEISKAKKQQAKVAKSLGKFLKAGEQFMIPPGSSLHYQGTVRMGVQDDGFSVCDSYSRVWGFKNLYVGGNGVIPTSTACNPTLTSVALAIRSCERIVSNYKSGSKCDL